MGKQYDKAWMETVLRTLRDVKLPMWRAALEEGGAKLAYKLDDLAVWCTGHEEVTAEELAAVEAALRRLEQAGHVVVEYRDGALWVRLGEQPYWETTSNLCKAAPALLAACEAMLSAWDDLTPGCVQRRVRVIARMRSTVAEARGGAVVMAIEGILQHQAPILTVEDLSVRTGFDKAEVAEALKHLARQRRVVAVAHGGYRWRGLPG